MKVYFLGFLFGFLQPGMKVARELSFSDRRSKQNVSIVVNVSNSMETNFMLDEV